MGNTHETKPNPAKNPGESAGESPGESGAFALIVSAAILAALAWQAKADPAPWNAAGAFLLLKVRSALAAALAALLALLLGYSVLTPLQKRWGLGGAPSDPPGRPSLILSLALGWGLLSHFVWLLAAIGSATGVNLFSRWTPLLVFAACLLLSRNQAREIVLELAERSRLLSAAATSWTAGRWRLVLPPALVLLGLVVLRLFATALTPSYQYDVLEYHLPAVHALIRTGSFASAEGNAYLQMPQGAESLYAFTSLLEGGVGHFAPKLLNLCLALTTLALMDLLLRMFRVGSPLRLLAMLLLLAHPISFKMLADAYVDAGTAMFATAALVCWARSVRRPNRLDPLLAAVFLGFAFSCKYPVLGVAVLPFLVFLAPLTPPESLPLGRGSRSIPALAGSMALLGLVAGVVYAPWLLRALVCFHSPFPPLTLPWFGATDEGTHAIQTCMARYHQSISPFSREYLGSVVSRLPVAGVLLALPAVSYAFLRRAGPLRRGLALFALAGYLVWNTAPNAEDRFLAPLLPAMVALAVAAVSDLGRRVAPAGILAAGALGLWAAALVFSQAAAAFHYGIPQVASGVASPESFLEKTSGSVTAQFFRAINDTAARQAGPRVLLLYEARAAALDPAIPVVSNTVFDRCPLWELLRSEKGGDPRWVLEELRRSGITLLAVNEAELARLLGAYPAQAAREDAQYRFVAAGKVQGSFNPRLLAFRRYYPPFACFGASQTTADTEKRLDRFLEYVRSEHRPVWETVVGEPPGARFWVSEIIP